MDIYRRKPHENPAIERTITRKAWQIVQRRDFNFGEREEVEHLIHLRIFEKEKYFDEDRMSREAFASMIADQCVATNIRDRHAQKRGPSYLRSLHEEWLDVEGEKLELWQKIPADQCDHASGRRRRTEKELAELRHDLDVVLNRLSDRDRDICLRLMEASVSQVARDLRVPLSKLRSILGRLRTDFVDAAIDEYLGPDFVKSSLN